MSAWLRVFRPLRAPRARLVCFPHAGGNASFYRSWPALLPAGVELHAVQYPGRLDRISEPLVRRMDEMADRSAEAVTPLLGLGPVLLFGHSMGASLAHEVARRLPGGPAALAVSGRPAPDRLRGTKVHLADDDTLWAELGRLGGTDRDTLDHAALRELTLPVLRADYEVAETYEPSGGPPLSTDVVACLGSGDEEVTDDEACAWARHTTGGFRLVTFPGGHFYLAEQPRAVIAAVVGTAFAGEGDCP